MIGYRFSLLIELIGSENVAEAKREKRAEIRSKAPEELRKQTEEEQAGGEERSALDYTLHVRQAAPCCQLAACDSPLVDTVTRPRGSIRTVADVTIRPDCTTTATGCSGTAKLPQAKSERRGFWRVCHVEGSQAKCEDCEFTKQSFKVHLGSSFTTCKSLDLKKAGATAQRWISCFWNE